MQPCLYILDKCRSTQDVARAWTQSKRAWDGLVFACANQTHGYGQQGRPWEASAGQNALFTMVLYPREWVATDLVALQWAAALTTLSGSTAVGGGRSAYQMAQ